ncbi:MAG: hypothetical protein AABZ06_01575 [Bdellovibrionota bacterium]
MILYLQKIFAVIFLILSLTFLAQANLKPQWSKKRAAGVHLNSSFLADLDNKNFNSKGTNFITEAMSSADVRDKYSTLHGDYEMRKRHGLIDTDAERCYLDQMSGFNNEILSRLRLSQLRDGRKKLETAMLRNDRLKAIAGPIVMAGAIAAACTTGEPLEFTLTDNTKLVTRADVRNQVGQLSVASQALTGSLDLMAKTPGEREERYRFSLNSGIPLFNVTSGISYGMTSNTLSMSLTKQLSSRLSCSVDSTRPLDNTPLASSLAQESVRLLYGFNF